MENINGITKSQAVQFIDFLNNKWSGKSNDINKYIGYGLILIGLAGSSNYVVNDASAKVIVKFMQKKSGKKVSGFAGL